MKRYLLAAVLVVLPLGLLAQSGSQSPPPDKALDNSDVIAMTAAGVGESTVIAAVEHAPKENLDVQSTAVAKLKKAGVGQAVIDAMVKRAGQRGRATVASQASAQAQTPGADVKQTGSKPASSSPVSISVDNQWVPLEPLNGQTRTVFSFPVEKIFIDYPGANATVRLKATQPAIRIESASDPRNVFFLVRLDLLRNKDTRTLRYGSGLSFSAPAKEYDVLFDLEKSTDGAWTITPRQPLRPAEYGIFTVLSREQQATALYGFGVE